MGKTHGPMGRPERAARGQFSSPRHPLSSGRPCNRCAMRRGRDAEATLAEISRIRAQLGWQPEVDFAEGLAELKQRMQAGLE